MKTARRVLIAAVLLALGACFFAGLLGVEPFKGWVGAFGISGSALVAWILSKAVTKPKGPDIGKIKEEAREKVLSQDPSAVVAALDDRARAGIDAAKQSGVDAGVAAATAYLHGGAGTSGGTDSGSGGGR